MPAPDPRLIFPLRALAGQFPGPSNGFRFLPSAPFRGLLVVAAHLHFPEDPLALHLLFERLQRLIDIIFSYDDVYQALPSTSIR